jgi:hypothetical protein
MPASTSDQGVTMVCKSIKTKEKAKISKKQKKISKKKKNLKYQKIEKLKKNKR